MLKILQRYVMGEILRSFVLALLTLTSVIVLFMVMIEASKMGLSPTEIINLIPYVVPGSLPYTIPVSLLFSVTVVYGRLASDNEIVAVKTAGLSAWTVLRPSFMLGLTLSGLLLFLSHTPIPHANYMAKLIIFQNMEEMFYKFLKKDRQFNNPTWPFLITVQDVDGKTMINPTFKHREGTTPGLRNKFDMIIQAKTARIHFDTETHKARVYLDGAEVSDPRKDVSLINNTYLDFDLPDERGILKDKKLQEFTTPEIAVEQARYKKLMIKERKRQAMAASLWMGMGRFNRIDWQQVHRSFVDYGVWKMQLQGLETEKHQRVAMACGSLFFVLLGAPVGILFARRDFLSAFISCFVPIIILYYPLILLGTNMGKDDLIPPVVALWLGNLVLAVLSGLVLPSVMKH